jgi:symplekin
MPKLARAAAKKYGAAKIAAQVAELADTSESGLLMSFLDNLVPVTGPAPAQELIDACIKIQESRLVDGKKDPRFIIPVLSGMKRTELETRLPFLVATEDNVFKASLHRMSEKLKRQALSFREEVDEEPLLGMTLCEQVVYLHRLDFTAAKIPQKRYLEAIRLCMEYDDVYTDRVIMAALDNISNVALSEQSQELPLAYMRTVILTCSKHETLHSWICHVLLPRLVECQIYNNGRQWEGWMRCARMLENGDGGVSSVEAINQLPEEQYNIYRNKYP